MLKQRKRLQTPSLLKWRRKLFGFFFVMDIIFFFLMIRFIAYTFAFTIKFKPEKVSPECPHSGDLKSELVRVCSHITMSRDVLQNFPVTFLQNSHDRNAFSTEKTGLVSGIYNFEFVSRFFYRDVLRELEVFQLSDFLNCQKAKTKSLYVSHFVLIE